MKTHLKIKLKTLAAEAGIIRNEELKWKDRARQAREKQRKEMDTRQTAMRESLYQHRYRVVRPETRSSQLAYGFIRGHDYPLIENRIREGNDPDFKRVEEIVKTFTRDIPGTDWIVTAQKFEEWQQGAVAHIKALNEKRSS